MLLPASLALLALAALTPLPASALAGPLFPCCSDDAPIAFCDQHPTTGDCDQMSAECQILQINNPTWTVECSDSDLTGQTHSPSGQTWTCKGTTGGSTCYCCWRKPWFWTPLMI